MAILKERIIAEFMGATGDLDEETRLIDEEVIDSLGIFMLLGFIKERFDVEVDPEDVTLENFATLSRIVRLVEKKT